MATDNGAQLTLDYRRCGVNGKVTVTARLGDKPVHVDTFDITCAKQRDAYAAAVAQKCPGIDVTELQEELLRLADEHVQEGAKRADNRPPPGANGQADQAAQQESDPKDEPAQPGHSCQSGKKSQATVLLGLVRGSGLEFWRDPKGKAWVSVPKDGHIEHWKVRSQAFQAFLCGLFFKTRKKSISSQAISDAVRTMECWSIYEGPEYSVAVRVGWANGKLYLDLADDQWRAVEADQEGWRVVTNPPVRFKRAPGMKPLPKPNPQGRVDRLREFVRVDDSQWPLLVGWAFGGLQPGDPRPVPYPVLVLHGEQGTGKSTTARMLQTLLDPSEAAPRTSPRDERDLMIAANNGWVLNFDNLSSMQDWLSDALCRVSSGGALGTRQLYTDDEEIIFTAARPMILNGINKVAERGDLLQRSILVELSVIPEAERRAERELWERFHAALPDILGGLLNAVPQALAKRDSIKCGKFRMQDFARWVIAGGEALGLQPGEFERAYAGNQEEAVEETLQASAIGPVFCKAFSETERWVGTASDLLDVLNDWATDSEKKHFGWPKSPNQLGKTLKRIVPALRSRGWNVEWVREGKGRQRTIKIEKVGKPITGDDQPRTTGGQQADNKADKAAITPTPPQPFTHKGLTSEADKADKADKTLPQLSHFDMAAPSGPSLNTQKADGQAGDPLEEELGDLSDLFEEPTDEGEWIDL